MLTPSVSQVRIRCASDVCKDYDLCVPCFAQGSSTREHNPATHPYSVIEQHSIPIFTDDWGADEETLLLEGAETYGLGSWADIADHIGGYREKEEVRDHYINTYIKSSKFPLPEHASPADTALHEEWPREKFLPRKKRRIEARKEERANAPVPKATDKESTASVPACHEVAGYMPGRLEFETEEYNEAEEAVMHMQFEPGEGDMHDPAARPDDEVSLKMAVMRIYNSRLTARVERKRIIFEHELLDYKRNAALEKKLSTDERQLLLKAKPFARLMKKDDFQDFAQDLLYEHNVREAIAQLQEWRRMQISDFKSGAKYEQEKAGRLQRLATGTNQYERFASNRSKPLPAVETPPAVAALIGPDLPSRNGGGLQTSPRAPSQAAAGAAERKPLTNGDVNVNGAIPAIPHRPKFVVAPAANVPPFKFENTQPPDLHLLTSDEREVCSILRIMPKPYIAMKENVIREAQKHGGVLKKKSCRDICRIDSTKAAKLFEYWSHSGWIAKA